MFGSGFDLDAAVHDGDFNVVKIVVKEHIAGGDRHRDVVVLRGGQRHGEGQRQNNAVRSIGVLAVPGQVDRNRGEVAGLREGQRAEGGTRGHALQRQAFGVVDLRRAAGDAGVARKGQRYVDVLRALSDVQFGRRDRDHRIRLQLHGCCGFFSFRRYGCNCVRVLLCRPDDRDVGDVLCRQGRCYEGQQHRKRADQRKSPFEVVVHVVCSFRIVKVRIPCEVNPGGCFAAETDSCPNPIAYDIIIIIVWYFRQVLRDVKTTKKHTKKCRPKAAF